MILHTPTTLQKGAILLDFVWIYLKHVKQTHRPAAFYYKPRAGERDRDEKIRKCQPGLIPMTSLLFETHRDLLHTHSPSIWDDQNNCTTVVYKARKSHKSPTRGADWGFKWRVTHITFTQETGVCVPCGTKCQWYFYKPDQFVFVPKLYVSISCMAAYSKSIEVCLHTTVSHSISGGLDEDTKMIGGTGQLCCQHVQWCREERASPQCHHVPMRICNVETRRLQYIQY